MGAAPGLPHRATPESATVRRHADARWDTMYEIRDNYAVAARPPRNQVWRRFPLVHLAHVGLLPKSRLLQFTNGYTTQFGFNDGGGSGLASMLLSLPAVKQRQAGIPQMNLHNWEGDAFVEDSWQLTSTPP